MTKERCLEIWKNVRIYIDEGNGFEFLDQESKHEAIEACEIAISALEKEISR